VAKKPTLVVGLKMRKMVVILFVVRTAILIKIMMILDIEGMRGCCKCGEEQQDKLIMGSCVCEKYFNLCSECATTNNEGDCQTT